MAELTLDGVTKRYREGASDEIVAVDGVSMDIADGEFLVLVGPSGCGKSTTLRMIAGLESLSAGEIRLGDRLLNDVPPGDRDIALVFQSYALYPHMTVRENMSFGLEESTDMPDDAIAEVVTETAEMMDIADLLDRTPGELSGGQQQRVALGRAIVREPEVFLMDEPLSNLDANLRAQMRTELQRLQEDLDTATVYVTHDQREAMTMGDRIAVLDEGRLQQVGTPLECYHQPANLFVAGFIGEPPMNTVPVERREDRLVADAFGYRPGEGVLEDLGDATELVFGVRPEDIELGGAGPDGTTFEASVDVVEPMGDENVVHLSVGGGDGATFVATVDGMVPVEAGESVRAHVPRAAVHVFDRASGAALHNREVAGSEAPVLGR